jgi:hypothetical protein
MEGLPSDNNAGSCTEALDALIAAKSAASSRPLAITPGARWSNQLREPSETLRAKCSRAT